MTGTAIRRAARADAGRIAEIHRASRAASMPWLRVVHTPEEDVAYFETTVLAEADVWVAETRFGVLGFAARSGGWLDHLYIAPEAFGRGFGLELLDAARAGQPRLQLWTFQRNLGARAFYERHGFVLAEQTNGSRNEESEPDARYSWESDCNDIAAITAFLV